MASETFAAKMHENEEVEEVNVLEYQPNFPTSFWIRSILLGIVLVPLRLFLLGICAIAEWLWALFITHTGLGHKGLDFIEWTEFVARLSAGLLFSVEGVKSYDAPIVLLGPHTTFFYAWVTCMVKPRPVPVVAEFQRRIPFLGEH